MASINGIEGAWLAHRFVAACVIASVLLVSVTARADRGDPHSLPAFIYYSHDPALVEIFIGHRLGTPRQQGRTISLPRAMIEYADGYTRPEYPLIPDMIRTDHLGLTLLHPNGTPVSLAAQARRQQSGEDETEIISSPEFRENMSVLRVRFNKLNPGQEGRYLPLIIRPSKTYSPAKIGEFDGLDVYGFSGRKEIFVPKGKKDEFFSVSCRINRRKHSWCQYSFRINEFLTGTASMVSLRYFGGRRFANRRIREIRLALCKYIECKVVNVSGILDEDMRIR